jgi:hypothetical protein
MQQTVVLDVDHSTGPLSGRLVVPLENWQEALRFGCSLGTLRRFRRVLLDTLPQQYATVMLGSGDFHHLSWPLIERVPSRKPFQVVVLDNHPDNMRFPFGVHCGSWVRRVALMPQVSHVHVVGICSGDIGRSHAWENYLLPLKRGKLSYWSAGVDVSWAKRVGLGHAFRGFDSIDAMTQEFADRQRSRPQATYLSIDKDVFSPDVAHTNWDQGQMQLTHASAIIQSLRGGLLGSDITGEISAYRYRRWWKRRLSAIDQQPPVDPMTLDAWQQQQHLLNEQLLSLMQPLYTPA